MDDDSHPDDVEFETPEWVAEAERLTPEDLDLDAPEWARAAVLESRRSLDFEPPEWVRDAARLAPGGWISLVDPAWPQDLDPPVYAVAGGWRVDRQGEPVEFRANPQYRPSPTAQGLPEPTDALDAAIQAGASGYGPPDAVLDQLMEATVAVPTQGEGGPPLTGVDPEGLPVLAVYSAPSHLRAREAGPYRVVPGRDLSQVVPAGCDVLVNPDAGWGARIAGTDLNLRTEQEPFPGYGKGASD